MVRPGFVAIAMLSIAAAAVGCSSGNPNANPLNGQSGPGTSVANLPTTAAAPLDRIGRAVAAAVEAQQLCAGMPHPAVDRGEYEKIAVERGTTLLAIPCWRHAYNVDYQFALWDGRLRPITIPSYEVDHQPVTHVPTIDAAGVGTGAEFEVVWKERGLGDCGSLSRYRFDGSAIALLRVRAKTECDGKYEDWPIVYERAADH